MPQTHPKSPVKILHVIDRLNVGGAAVHAILLTKYFNTNGEVANLDKARLAKAEMDVSWQSVLVYGQEGDTEGNMVDLVKDSHIRSYYLPSLGRELNPLRDLISLWKMLRLIQIEKPFIIDTHKSKAGVIGRLAAIISNVPVKIHTYHGHVFHGYFGKLKSRLFIEIERWMARFTDHLIAVSPKVKEDLVRYRIAPSDKITVMCLGFDLQNFAFRKRNDGTLRKDLGLKPEIPLIGIIARLVPIKGIPLFLQTAKELLTLKPEAHFVIVGDGELRPELKLLAHSLGINDQVHFTGFRRDIENIYPDLDVLALTSSNEGSPVSLIEGLASGCAVVATDVGGVSDVVQDGSSGLLVGTQGKSQEEIAKLLAAQMFKLLNDPVRRGQLGENGRKDVLRRFSIDRLRMDLSALYLQSLSQKVL
jgi:glycosyltransferase involved in cell wall biosynthesis